jgi:hypothetical protein
MKALQTEDKTINKLLAYFDKRFNALEDQLAVHSSMINSISVDVRKLLSAQSRNQSKELMHKELALTKSFNNPSKQQKSKEQKCVVRLQLSDTKQKQSNKENAVAGQGVSSKQSPRISKVLNKKESKRTRNARLEVFKTTEENYINSVFSPNSHTGETKELIIEPIEVMFQESPSSLLENTTKKYNKQLSPNATFNSLSPNCLFLMDQFLGKVIPEFAIISKSILEKYIKFTSKEISNQLIKPRNQRVRLMFEDRI